MDASHATFAPEMAPRSNCLNCLERLKQVRVIQNFGGPLLELQHSVVMTAEPVHACFEPMVIEDHRRSKGQQLWCLPNGPHVRRKTRGAEETPHCAAVQFWVSLAPGPRTKCDRLLDQALDVCGPWIQVLIFGSDVPVAAEHHSPCTPDPLWM